MGLSENLVEAKTELNDLLDFANETTGEEDTTLGDAVKRLCDGFGQGASGGLNVETVDIIVDSYSSYSTLSGFFGYLINNLSLSSRTSYRLTVDFENNTTNTRAGIFVRTFVIGARIENSFPVIIERVGHSGTNNAYGIDVYPNCILHVKMESIDLDE